MYGTTGAGMRAALFIGTAALGLASGTAMAAGPAGPGDFGQLAKNGFAYAVNGDFYLDAGKTQFPNLPSTGLGGPDNTYSWSMAWFNNQIWVGTNRDALGGTDLTARANAGPAEIWRYTPSTIDWGLSGIWQRIYQSPNVSRLISYASGGTIPTNMPRDAGYRNMTVCNAGGTGTTQRLYVTATGLPPGILYWNGSTFATTSTTGFPTTLFSLNSSTADFGFRGLVCFKGRLFASPAGTATDVDIANHPVLLMNTNPAGGGSWSTVLDVKNGGSGLPAGMADPDNIGIFQIVAMGNYLWLSVINRTTGFELWRGDGTACNEPWVSSTCTFTWAKVIDNGAGRPADYEGPTIDNAGATLGVYGHDLYVAPAESGFYAPSLAELLRVQNADTATSPKWQLLAGWPRKNFADPSHRLPGLDNIVCDPNDVGNMPRGDLSYPPSLWTTGSSFFRHNWLSADELDDATSTTNADCMPATGSGPGLGLDATYKNPLLPGQNNYFWRMAEHDGELYIGTLDLSGGGSREYPGEADGFNIYKTVDGINWTQVVNNGLGNPDAYGVRSIVSTPLGLFVGSANGTTSLPNGGTNVFLGTTAPAGQTAPKADAGANQVKYDTSNVGTLSFTLSGSGADTFGGYGPVTFEWFAGTGADNCAGLDPNSPTLVSTSATAAVNVASNAPNPNVNSDTYTLRVTNQAGRVGCDEVTVTASHNLPPTVNAWYSNTNPMVFSVPATYSTSSATVNLIDGGGAGSIGYDVTAICNDSDSALVTCAFQAVTSPGVTLSNIVDTSTNPSLCNGRAACQISAHLSVPDWTTLSAAGSTGSALRPTVQVLAVDNQGYQATRSWDSVAQPVTPLNPAGQDNKPVCRNADITMIIGQDTSVAFDPTAVIPPICVDPDGDTMTYTPRSAGSFPSYGAVSFGSTTITYTPTDPNTPMVDYFAFRASDGQLTTNSTPSRDPIVRVTLTQDAGKPSVAVSFPANGGNYNSAGFADGCATPGVGDVCGTASDDLSGVQSVQVAIRDASGNFWNGSAFVDNAGTPLWQTATIGAAGTWGFPFAPPADGSYALLAKSVDRVGNASAVTETPFSQHGDTTPPTIAISFPATGGSYSPTTFLSGCSTPSGDVCGTAADAAEPGSGVDHVQASIQRSDGAWWNGSAFAAGGQLWLPAQGTPTAWNLPFIPADGSYTVFARAFDHAGNASAVAQAAFSQQSQQSDNVAPTVSITFPASGAKYSASAYNRGCSTSVGDMCGTASDDATGVSAVQVSITRASDSARWDGSAFVTGAQIWLPASGTTSWTYAFSAPKNTGFSVQARATDGSGNTGTSAARSFSTRRF